MADSCASFKKDIKLENREISPKSDISNGVFKISTERDCHEVKSVLNAILKDLYILENMKIYEELLKCSDKHHFHALLCTCAQADVRERHNRHPFDYLDLEITAVNSQNISNAKKNKEIGYPYHQNSVNDSVDSQRDEPKSRSYQAQDNQFDAAKSPYISSNIILFSISLNVIAILFVFHSFDISRNVYAMSRFFIVLCFVALCIFASCNIDKIFTEVPDEGIKFDQVSQLSEEDHDHSRSKSKSLIGEADHSDQSVSTDLNNYSALHSSRLDDEKLAANLLQILEDDDFSYTVGDCDDSIDGSCSDLMEAFSYTSPMDLEIPGYAVCDQCGHELRWYPLLDSDLPEAEQGRHEEIKVCLKAEDIKDIAIGDSLEKTTNYDIEAYNGCLSSWHSSPDIACSLNSTMQQRSDLIEKSVNSGDAPCATTGLSLSTYKKFNVILESTSTSFESLSSIIQETHSSKIISSSEISSNTSCGTQSPISQTASSPKHMNRNPSVEKTHTSLKNIIRIKKNYGNFYSFSSGETSSLLTQLSDELDSCLDAGDTEDTEDNKDTEDTEVASSSAFGKKSVLRRRLSAIARSWKENLTVSTKRIKYEKCTE